MKAQCLCCYKDFDGESVAITIKGVDICPTCRRHAEIGRRVSEMEPKDEDDLDFDQDDLKSLAHHLRRLADVAACSPRKSAPLIVKKALLALSRVLARYGVEEKAQADLDLYARKNRFPEVEE